MTLILARSDMILVDRLTSFGNVGEGNVLIDSKVVEGAKGKGTGCGEVSNLTSALQVALRGESTLHHPAEPFSAIYVHFGDMVRYTCEVNGEFGELAPVCGVVIDGSWYDTFLRYALVKHNVYDRMQFGAMSQGEVQNIFGEFCDLMDLGGYDVL